MTSNAEHNIQMIEAVAAGLGTALLKEMAFVGGCTTALLVTDYATLDDIRLTVDVDLVIELAGIGAWEKLTRRLAEKQFKITGQDEVNCRFRFNDLIVDVMPSDENVLGYSNRWFTDGLANAMPYQLPSGTNIQVFKPPYLVATKLEAFAGRGNGDYASQDLEDIVILVDGRPELLAEVGGCPADLKGYIANGIKAIPDMSLVIQSSSSVRANPGRARLIHQRLKALGALG